MSPQTVSCALCSRAIATAERGQKGVAGKLDSARSAEDKAHHSPSLWNSFQAPGSGQNPATRTIDYLRASNHAKC